MNLIEQDVIRKINGVIDSRYLESSTITLCENKGSVNSIVVNSKSTPYRQSGVNSVLFARIKTDKKTSYISFADKYKDKFSELSIPFKKVRSDDFVRIEIPVFLEDIEKLKPVLNYIFTNSFNFPSFGCCSRFRECSAAKRCLHPDIIYASACAYKSNLDNGKIFY